MLRPSAVPMHIATRHRAMRLGPALQMAAVRKNARYQLHIQSKSPVAIHKRALESCVAEAAYNHL